MGDETKQEDSMSSIHKKLNQLSNRYPSNKHTWNWMLWAIMLLLLLSQNSKIRKMSQNLDTMQQNLGNMNNLVNGLNSNVNSLDYEIGEQVKEQLQQTMSEIASYEISYTDINPVQQTVIAEVMIHLKSFEQGNQYCLQIMSLNDHVVTETDLIGEAMHRSCTITLPADTDYSVSFYKKTAGGGALLTTEDIQILAQEYMKNRVEIRSNSGMRSSGEMYRLVDLYNHTYGYEEAKIKKVEAILSYDGEEFATIPMSENLDDELSIRGDYGTSEAAVSGTYSNSHITNDGSSTISDDGLQIENSEDELVTYQMKLTESQIRELLDVKENEEVQFYNVLFHVKITFFDGTTLIPDEVWSIY